MPLGVQISNAVSTASFVAAQGFAMVSFAVSHRCSFSVTVAATRLERPMPVISCTLIRGGC